MPELPEVETIRRFLEQNIIGLSIESVTILNSKSFSGDISGVIGSHITGFSRLGKQLSLHLSNQSILHFHLKMTGQIVYSGSFLGHPTPNRLSVPNSSTRIIFTFHNQSRLYFNDQRKFGWVKVLSHSELAEFQSHLGYDILNSEFTLKYFSAQLNSSRPIKSVLLDQNRFAGIGNIYANDALFLAGIHPQVRANKLNTARVKRLYSSIVSVINEAVSHQGSTAADDKYVLPDGTKGSHQYHFRVYQRAGEPCSVCSHAINRITVGGRGTFLCPNCQKW